MDEAALRRLACDGLLGLPPAQLADLATWCWDWCEASGDGRYCSLSRTLAAVDRWLTWHDERGGVPVELVNEIDDLIKTHLPGIIEGESPADGAT